MSDTFPPAPPLQVSRWFNTPAPITLETLRGRVVALHAFQMLCPGCVSHGLPQARRMAQVFAPRELSIVGLHTVFEHHDVMTERALQAFIQEYRLRFPIGVDQPSPHGSVPLTMRAYGLQGTPSLVLLDKRGRVRLSHLGEIDDLALGAIIGRLLAEPGPADDEAADEATTGKAAASTIAAGAAATGTASVGTASAGTASAGTASAGAASAGAVAAAAAAAAADSAAASTAAMRDATPASTSGDPLCDNAGCRTS